MSKDLDDCNLPKILERLTGISGWEEAWEPKQTGFSRSYALSCHQKPYGGLSAEPDEHYQALVELDGYMLSVYAGSSNGVTFIEDSRNPEGWRLDFDLSGGIDEKYKEFLEPALERAKIQLEKEENQTGNNI